MSAIYRVGSVSMEKLDRFEQVLESEHVHEVVRKHPELLGGDHFDPDEPRRWIVLASEVPVPEPEEGRDNWSLDLLLADQDATPTLVECKVERNAESRREIIGQMIEYAANAKFYWPLEEFRKRLTDRFERFSNETSQSLSDRIGALDSDVSQTVDAFLTEFFRKLTAGEIRLVLVLDYASRRLKSSVEFINEQLERIDFNLVELRHTRNGDQILIAPQLFGYSERTRNIKRLAIERAVGARATREWDEGTFLEALAKRPTSESASRAVQEFLQRLPQLGFSIDWGRGLTVGSFGLRRLDVCPRRLAQVGTDGKLWLNLEYTRDQQQARYRELIAQMLPGVFPEKAVREAATLSLALEDWIGKNDVIVALLKAIPPESSA